MPTTLSKEMLDAAREAAQGLKSDVFFYNGAFQSGPDLRCIEAIHAAKRQDSATLFLTTNGGDPDAGYKLARYFQDRYKTFTCVISGRCKSAGTLVAIGASELAFSPYGELGPLDIQLTKVDKFDHLESGLTIQDSFDTLQARAIIEYLNMVQTYIRANNGLLSFASATDAASKFITGLYGPVFARIYPEEVGARARSMRIAIDYGKRLSAWSKNLAKSDTLKTLAETYPSHSFVIDQQEAEGLFRNVRCVTPPEMAIVEALGVYARFELAPANEVHFHPLSDIKGVTIEKGSAHGKREKSRNAGAHQGNPPGADESPVIPTRSAKRGSGGPARVNGFRRGNGTAATV